MPDLYKSLEDEILTGFDNSTPSPASEAGRWLCELRDGPLTEKSGRALAPASPSPRRAKVAAQAMKGTCGPSSCALSKREDQKLFLENKSLPLPLSEKLGLALQKVTRQYGSMEYEQTWKRRVTPLGSPYWAHTASARRISASDFIGWPTCQAHDVTGRSKTQKAKHGTKHGCSCLVNSALLVGWPVTTALADVVKLEGWPKTPAACDGEGGTFDVLRAIRENLSPKAKLRDWALVAGWATARAKDGTNPAGMSTARQEDGKAPDSLHLQTKLVEWPTTSARDSKTDGKDGPNRTGSPSLPGLITELFLVPMGRRVVLAPEFSLWLMGFPEAWVTAAPGAKDWLEAQAAQELECSKDRETPSSPSLPPSL